MASNFRFAALVVCCAALTAASVRPAEAQDTPAARCSVAVNAQDLDGVIDACPAALEELPTDHPFYDHFQQTLNYAFGQRCTPAAQSQDWDSVLTYCVPAAPMNPGLNFVIGLAYQAKQDWANAGPYFEAFVSAAGSSGGQSEQVALAQRSGGLALVLAGAPDRAIPMLQGAAAANRSDLEVQFRLGIALAQTGDTAGADEALSVVIDEGPDSPLRTNALLVAGQINHQAGDYDRSVPRLAEYLEKGDSARFSTVHLLLAQSLEESDPARAATHYRSYIDGVGSGGDSAQVGDAHWRAGTIFYNDDDCASAEQHYQQMLEISPNHPNAAQAQEILAAIAEGGCGGDC